MSGVRFCMKDRHLHRFRLMTGGLLFGAIVLTAVLAPWLAPANPLTTDLSHRLLPPCAVYPMGTDQLGRCVFSRVLFGTRLSLPGALAASVLALFVGAGVGIVSAADRPMLQWGGTAVIDMGLALPGLILAMVVAGLLGGSMVSLVTGLVLSGWPWWARWIRGLALSAREREFVLAGQVVGVKRLRMLRHYIFPQLKQPILAALSLKTGWMILAFSGMSYLGLGPPPPAPEWGRMLQESSLYMTRAPWLMLAPGTMITLTVLALNLLGEGLQGEGP